jgi:prephenate dehydratase
VHVGQLPCVGISDVNRNVSPIAVFEAVEKGRTTYGLVPFENSTYGSVIETMDYLMHTELQIRAETYLTVSWFLNERQVQPGSI